MRIPNHKGANRQYYWTGQVIIIVINIQGQVIPRMRVSIIQEIRCLAKCSYSCLSELKPTVDGLQLEYLSRISDLTSAQNFLSNLVIHLAQPVLHS